MSYFEATNLYKKYEDIEIDFSLTAEKNSMTAILGKSGSGKSTVLKLISGLLENDVKPDCQEKTSILLEGKDITELKPSKRNIGMVFQSPSLFMNMNAAENTAYGLICQGMKKKDALVKAEEMLENVGLKDFGKRDCSSLSGGEAQRVSLARTLIVNPKLVLFDEPLSALDAPLRKKLSSDIIQWQKEKNFTGILVTHDINEAKAMCSRILLMEKGKKIWEGQAEDFTEDLMKL